MADKDKDALMHVCNIICKCAEAKLVVKVKRINESSRDRKSGDMTGVNCTWEHSTISVVAISFFSNGADKKTKTQK